MTWLPRWTTNSISIILRRSCLRDPSRNPTPTWPQLATVIPIIIIINSNNNSHVHGH